jgi:hypothetical protein
MNIVERQKKSLILLKNELESVKTARRINRESNLLTPLARGGGGSIISFQ